MKRDPRWMLTMAAAAWVLVLTSALATAADKGNAMKVGKKGDVTFTKETKIGDLTLKPGRYFFQHRMEGEDHFVHFTEVTKANPYSGGLGGGEEKAHPGEVKCRLEPLSKKAETTLIYSEDEDGVKRITRIEVQGETVAHLF